MFHQSRLYLLAIAGFFWLGCEAPKNPEAEQQALLQAQADAQLLADFQLQIQSARQLSQAQALQSSLADQLARLPAQDVQKILVSQPDSGIQITKIDTNQIKPILIENAAMLMAVRSYEDTRKKITALCAQMEGFISSEGEKFSETRVENTLDLQIPAAQFQNAINQLRDMAMILREKQTWREDLTVNWSEIQTRLEAKKSAELRLKDLLKAGKAGEVLAVQRELDLLYEDMQALNRSAKIIRDKGLFSQIKVAFYQDLNQPAEAQADFSQKFSHNLQNGWAHFQNGLLTAASYWVHISIGLLILLIAWLARRNSQRQARAHQQQLWQQQQQWLQQQKKNQN